MQFELSCPDVGRRCTKVAQAWAPSGSPSRFPGTTGLLPVSPRVPEVSDLSFAPRVSGPSRITIVEGGSRAAPVLHEKPGADAGSDRENSCFPAPMSPGTPAYCEERPGSRRVLLARCSDVAREPLAVISRSAPNSLSLSLSPSFCAATLGSTLRDKTKGSTRHAFTREKPRMRPTMDTEAGTGTTVSETCSRMGRASRACMPKL